MPAGGRKRFWVWLFRGLLCKGLGMCDDLHRSSCLSANGIHRCANLEKRRRVTPGVVNVRVAQRRLARLVSSSVQASIGECTIVPTPRAGDVPETKMMHQRRVRARAPRCKVYPLKCEYSRRLRRWLKARECCSFCTSAVLGCARFLQDHSHPGCDPMGQAYVGHSLHASRSPTPKSNKKASCRASPPLQEARQLSPLLREYPIGLLHRHPLTGIPARLALS